MAHAASPSPGTERPVTVVLAGAHGHGRSHLRRLRQMQHDGVARLVGICDRTPAPPSALEGLDAVYQHAELDAVLERTGAELCIIATPIHTHLPLARVALEHDVHLLLEKPPTPSGEEYEQLLAAAGAAGAACQIGFQSLGSTALPAARQAIAEGAIGELRGIGAVGLWVRTATYFGRAEWTGRRRLRGHDVVDGALTNPFAHAVASALAVAGAEHTPAGRIELELAHAHPIDSDDTSCLRLHTPQGLPVTVAVTLCAEQPGDPYLVIHGSEGRMVLHYTRDVLEVHRADGSTSSHSFDRTDLVRNLVDHVRRGTALLVPPERARGFMGVMEAVRRAPDPDAIPTHAQRVSDTPDGRRRIVVGVDALVRRAAEDLALFSEIGVPWTPEPEAV